MIALLRSNAGPPAYLTLDEALPTGRFRVTEVSESGHVPELRVHNDLDTPVLLLDGEELVGAKQNRVVNLTILVPAHTLLTIPVSCVEAGRWHHVAATWDLPKAQLALFVDGQPVATHGPEQAPWPSSLTAAERSEELSYRHCYSRISERQSQR